MIAAFAGLGVVVSGVLLAAVVRGPVTAHLGRLHVSCDTGLRSGLLVVTAYVVATCGALVFSAYRQVAIFGWVNLIAAAPLARLEIDGFASLWCGWAAVTSGATALHLRYGAPHRATDRARHNGQL